MSELLHVPGRDDRTIEVLTAGDLDGFPLLFHGGSPSAVAAYEPFDAAARAQGLRLVTYSRPGYGASTPRPAAGRYADDVEESVLVLDHLGIGEFVTAGWSGGGPRALACAALLPDRCRAATSLAGVGPFHGEGLDWFAGMAEENLAEYHAAEQGPDAYAAYLAEHFAPILEASPDELAEAMGGLVPPVDQEAMTPAFTDWMSRTFHHAGVQGIVGVRDDGIAAVTPWGFDLGSIRVPVAIWQGRLDAMVPFAHAAWLIAHVPGAEGHLYEDHGHISILRMLDEVFADLRRMAGR